MNKLYKNLNEIKKDLNKKEDPLKRGVNIKINRSLSNYRKNIELNCKYILSRNNYKAFMAIDRYTKRKERNKNEEEVKWGFIETQ